MKRIKISKEELNRAKGLVIAINKAFNREGKLIKDSNIYHFVAYELNKKLNLQMACGWYKHGPYVLAVDDALIALKMMKKDQHQLYGKETPMDVWLEDKMSGMEFDAKEVENIINKNTTMLDYYCAAPHWAGGVYYMGYSEPTRIKSGNLRAYNDISRAGEKI